MATSKSRSKGAPATTPRASQKPTISFGMVAVKVGIGNVVKEGKVKGHYYDAETKKQANQQYVTEDGEKIDEKVTGYEGPNGHPVFFTQEELSDLAVGLKGVVQLRGFAEAKDIDPVYIDAMYNVWPDGPGQTKQFNALAKALRESGLAGVGTCCLTNTTRLIALAWNERFNHLLMHVCTFDHNFKVADIETAKNYAASGPQPTEAEVEMARMYVEAPSLRVDFKEFASGVRDDYQDALANAIKAKAKGQKVKPGKTKTIDETPDLLEALRASLNEVAEPPAKKRARTTTRRPKAKSKA